MLQVITCSMNYFTALDTQLHNYLISLVEDFSNVVPLYLRGNRICTTVTVLYRQLGGSLQVDTLENSSCN